MTITLEQQREYIDKVADRVINDQLLREAGVYRIDTMVELAPELKEYGQQAIDRIYKHFNKETI